MMLRSYDYYDAKYYDAIMRQSIYFDYCDNMMW